MYCNMYEANQPTGQTGHRVEIETSKKLAEKKADIELLWMAEFTLWCYKNIWICLGDVKVLIGSKISI